jgi:hypothetical protein
VAVAAVAAVVAVAPVVVVPTEVGAGRLFKLDRAWRGSARDLNGVDFARRELGVKNGRPIPVSPRRAPTWALTGSALASRSSGTT